MRIFRIFSSLPTLVRWAAIATAGLFVLALVVGFFNRSTPSAGSVSVIAPAARPSQIAAARPVATAPPPAAAPAPQTAVPVVSGGVMRSAQKLPDGTTFDDCANETLSLPKDDNTFNLEDASFIAAAARRECKTPTLSVSPNLAEIFAPYVPVQNRGYIQITRAGLFSAPVSGEYTLMIAASAGKPTRCALYAGDMSVPVLQGEDYHGRFGGVATIGLEAGHHEVALVCGFALMGAPATGGVTVSIRTPGEDMPRLMTLQTAHAPAPAAPAAIVQEPAK